MVRTYSDLTELDTLEDRYEFLKLSGVVGEETFGFERWVNQRFYRSKEWLSVRNFVIVRDNGMDLGSVDRPLTGSVYVHHMNPISLEDLEHGTDNLLDPEFLISASLRVHNAIHYGTKEQLPRPFVERRPGDTTPWKTT